MSSIELELTVFRDIGALAAYRTNLRFRVLADHVDEDSAIPYTTELNTTELLSRSLNPKAYGETLTAQIFSDENLKLKWAGFRGRAKGKLIHIRIRLPAANYDLHPIRWELLRDPSDQTGLPLSVSANVTFSRYLSDLDLGPLQTRPIDWRRTVVAIASPHEKPLPEGSRVYVEQVREIFGDVQIKVLAAGERNGRATLDRLHEILESSPVDILYLLAHGTTIDGQGYLFLETASGGKHRIKAEEFAEGLASCKYKPALVVLFSCQSSPSEADTADIQATLGPQLYRIGIPTVIAMRGLLNVGTAKGLLTSLTRKLMLNRPVEEALTAARLSLPDPDDRCMPILYLRSLNQLVWNASVTTPLAVTLADLYEHHTALSTSLNFWNLLAKVLTQNGVDEQQITTYATLQELLKTLPEATREKLVHTTASFGATSNGHNRLRHLLITLQADSTGYKVRAWLYDAERMRVSGMSAHSRATNDPKEIIDPEVPKVLPTLELVLLAAGALICRAAKELTIGSNGSFIEFWLQNKLPFIADRILCQSLEALRPRLLNPGELTDGGPRTESVRPARSTTLPLGCLYQVVIRIDRSQSASRSWRNFDNAFEQQTPQRLELIRTPQESAQDDLMLALTEPNIIGLTLGFSLTEVDEETQQNVVGSITNLGVPVALLPYAPLPENILAQLSQKGDTTQPVQWYELAKQVYTWRREAFRSKLTTHFGHHLSLIWDDPRRSLPRILRIKPRRQE